MAYLDRELLRAQRISRPVFLPDSTGVHLVYCNYPGRYSDGNIGSTPREYRIRNPRTAILTLDGSYLGGPVLEQPCCVRV
jgi:hypothetical protein